jgi:hypothetical protein
MFHGVKNKNNDREARLARVMSLDGMMKANFS